MKHMTPELIARLQSENEQIFDAADAAWDASCERYQDRIAKMRPTLTPSMNVLLDQVKLHDARVLWMGRADDRQFSICFQFEAPKNSGVLVTYELVSEPNTINHHETAQYGKPWEWALYDEIDIIQEKSLLAFEHSILLTGGIELQVTFSDLRLTFFRMTMAPGGLGQDCDDHADRLCPA